MERMALGLRRRLPALAVAVFCSLGALAAHAADAGVAGVWKGTMDTQLGPVATAITIEAAAPLAGNDKIAEYEGRNENGKLDGDKSSFEIRIAPGTITYAGTVSRDEMNLNVGGTTGNKMTLVAKRQK
jgi:hypothetical protein